MAENLSDIAGSGAYRRPPRLSLIDYWRMFRSGGPRLPWTYLTETQWFDWRHGVDTHRWMPLEYYDPALPNLSHGILYMCSWTSVVERTLRQVRPLAPFDLNDADFIDLGCGKGKVLLTWAGAMDDLPGARLFGVDYSADLLEICRRNLSRMNRREVNLIRGDVARLDLAPFRKNLVIYMYNPFDETVMAPLLDRLGDRNVIVIYNNPVHAHLLEARGYRTLYARPGWHPSEAVTILASPPRMNSPSPTPSSAS